MVEIKNVNARLDTQILGIVSANVKFLLKKKSKLNFSVLVLSKFSFTVNIVDKVEKKKFFFSKVFLNLIYD